MHIILFWLGWTNEVLNLHLWKEVITDARNHCHIRFWIFSVLMFSLDLQFEESKVYFLLKLYLKFLGMDVWNGL